MRHLATLALTFFLLALLALAWVGGRVAEAQNRLNETLEDLAMTQQDDEPLEARWKTADNVEHIVKTKRGTDPEEPLAEWVARHKAKVDAMKLAFPPVPAQTE